MIVNAVVLNVLLFVIAGYSTLLVDISFGKPEVRKSILDMFVLVYT